jgi:hypothetical protein
MDNLKSSDEQNPEYDIVTFVFCDSEDGTCGYVRVSNRNEYASENEDVIQYRESDDI